MIMASLNAPVSTKQAKQMMAEADIDGDGAIDFAEFFTIMTARLESASYEYHGSILGHFQGHSDPDSNETSALPGG